MENVPLDPLTHTLVGATLAELPAVKRVRYGRAAMIVGANLPDIDVLSFVGGTDYALGFRRGWTHGVLAMALLPLLLIWILRMIDRRRTGLSPPGFDSRALLWISYLAVVSHSLLDWLNTYGVRLLMPFDGRWFYGDALFIIDPWLWLMLGGSLLLARAGRGVGWVALGLLTSLLVLATPQVQTGARVSWVVGLCLLLAARSFGAGRLRGPRTAAIGISLAGIYVAAMILSTQFAGSWVREQIETTEGVEVGRMMVGPVPGNPFRRDVLAEVPGGYRFGTLRLVGRPELEVQGRLIERLDPEIADVSRDAPEIAGAVNWMRFPFADVQETADGYTVYLLDARYVRRRTDGFGSAVLYLDREELRP